MKSVMSAAILAVSVTVVGMNAAQASSLPAVDGNYEGTYSIADAFTPSNNASGHTHGLYLPGFIGNASWSVESGTATYQSGKMDMTGTASKTKNGTLYSLDFDFALTETANAPNGLICGNNNAADGCKTQKTANGGQGEANLVHFDMGVNGVSMGSLKGTAGTVLDGLVIDVVMVPLSGSNRKPGQLGYGGNWWTDAFGYSNWIEWKIVSNTSNQQFDSKYYNYRSGDVNVNLIATPLPAGIPLLLTALFGFAAMRRKQRAG